MSYFPRTVVGYHGCLEPVASQLLSGSIENWKASENRWDWLGHGIYFWEWAPERALRWAHAKAHAKGGEPAVIGAIIDLDRCFDLTNERFTRMLEIGYRQVERAHDDKGEPLPKNQGGPDNLRRELDCLVINATLARIGPDDLFTSVRSPFWEGDEAYPGAMLRKYTHVQIAVRDRACILGVFRPNLNR